MKLSHALFISLASLSSLTTAQAQQIADRATLDALLGSAQTFEDFESFNVVASAGADVLDTYLLDDTTIANGQGPMLVSAGAN